MIKHGYDVIIIGGGPAGLAAAEELAKNKKSVLLLEKNKEIGPKICGGGLTTKISELNIPLELVDKKFHTIKAYAGRKMYYFTLPWRFLATIDRKKLGQYQLKKVLLQGAEIRTNTLVQEITNTHVVINDQKIYFKYLIGADGSLSLTRKYLGIKTKSTNITFQYRLPEELPHLELHFDANIFGFGYLWIFPHQGYTLIGTGLEIKEAKGKNLKEITRRWCEQRNIDLSGAREESWIINSNYKGWDFGNIFLVGDAAGFTPSFTGEGIYPAMVSGVEVAKKIINPNYNCPNIKRILKNKLKQEKMIGRLKINKFLFNTAFNTILLLSRYKKPARKFHDFFLG